MSRRRVHSFAISLDGYGSGPDEISLIFLVSGDHLLVGNCCGA